MGLLTRDALHHEDPFGLGKMRELWMDAARHRNDVADGGEPVLAGEQGVRIDDHETSFHLHVGELLQIEVLGDRAPADGTEEHLRLELLRTLGGGDGRLHSRLGAVHLLQLGRGEGLDAPAPESLLELGGDVVIFERDQPGKQLDDGHLAPEPAKDGSELDSHRAGAEDDEALGDDLVVEQLVARDDVRAIHLETGQKPRRGAAREDDVFRLDGLVSRRSARDVDAPGPGEPGVAVHAVDLVLAEEELDALGVRGDHLLLALQDAGHVDRDFALHLDAVLLRLARGVQHLGGVEQRFGGDAAAQEAGAAETLVLLDAGDLEPQLPGTDRGDVAARSGPDHRDVVLRHFPLLCRRARGSSLGLRACQGGRCGVARPRKRTAEPARLAQRSPCLPTSNARARRLRAQAKWALSRVNPTMIRGSPGPGRMSSRTPTTSSTIPIEIVSALRACAVSLSISKE